MAKVQHQVQEVNMDFNTRNLSKKKLHMYLRISVNMGPGDLLNNTYLCSGQHSFHIIIPAAVQSYTDFVLLCYCCT